MTGTALVLNGKGGCRLFHKAYVYLSCHSHRYTHNIMYAFPLPVAHREKHRLILFQCRITMKVISHGKARALVFIELERTFMEIPRILYEKILWHLTLAEHKLSIYKIVRQERTLPKA